MPQHSGYDAQGNYIGQQTTEGAFGSAALQDYYQGDPLRRLVEHLCDAPFDSSLVWRF